MPVKIKYVLTYQDCTGANEQMEFNTLEEALNQIKLDHENVMEPDGTFYEGDWVGWAIKMTNKVE